MRSKRAIYALYQGEEMVMTGTVEEVARVLGVNVRTIHNYVWRTKVGYRKSKFEVVRIGDIKDEMCDL